MTSSHQSGINQPGISLKDKKQLLLANMKQTLGLGRQRAPLPPAVAGDAAAADRPFPLNPLQESYWLGQTGHFALGRVNAHFCNELEFDRPIDVARWQRAVDKLIERHEMLRAVVLPQGEWQVLAAPPPFEMQVHDFSALAPERQNDALLAMRRRLVDQGPATDRWPLIEMHLCRLGPHRCRIFISCSLLLFDGQSFHTFLNELRLFYDDPDLRLPPIANTYRDYIMQLQAFRESAQYRQAYRYWMDRLADLPGRPDLPLAVDPAKVPRPLFVHRAGIMERALWDKFKETAGQCACTPTSAILAAFTTVLARWSRTRHFTINIMYLNRLPLLRQVNEILGNMSTTVLFETDVDAVADFAAYARSVQEQLWTDFEHSSVHGVEVIRQLNRQAGGAAAASLPIVFASTLSLGKNQAVQNDNPWIHRIVHTSLQTPQVWMDMQVHEANGELLFNFDVVEELFPPNMVADLFEAFSALLRALAGEPALWRAAALPLLPPRHRDVRARANATDDAPVRETITDLVGRQAAETPERTAIIYAHGTVSYRELWRRAVCLAGELAAQGVRPNTLIAIAMDKGWEQVVAALAIIGAGAAYLPISPQFPRQRINDILEQGRVEILLTQSHLLGQLAPPPGVRVVPVDRFAPAMAATDAMPVAARAEDLAYVIFTSGSTGRPKGVAITHRAALNTIIDINRRFGVGPGDSVFALSELTFDLSVYDLFGPLIGGGHLVFPDPEKLRDPGHWHAAMTGHRVTLWNSAPSLMRLLTEHVAESGKRLPDSLRLVMLSGDWIPLSLPSTIREQGRNAAVVSLGGATEAAIWSIYYEIGDIDPEWTSIPYGRPLRNQKFHVLNARMEDCPEWVAGDLYIEGAGLALGYWQDEERTNAAFIVDANGRRLYKTGDWGRYLPDGNIEFLGRTDSQVKIQGYRIECGEIVAVLEQHPTVRTAVVLAMGDRQAERMLVAFVVGATGSEPDGQALRQFLGERLPSYMVPHRIVPLAALPLSHNGKVDRQALAKLELRPLAANKTAELPRTSTETRLGVLFCEVLGLAGIGIDDSFFAAGGTSLQAVRLLSKIEAGFGVAIGFARFLENQTVAQLAKLLADRAASSAQRSMVHIRSGKSGDMFCVHPIGGGIFNFVALAQRLAGDLNVFGFQSVGLEDGRQPLVTVEAMAGHYLSELLVRQPDGPYLLCGYSFGSLVAFEMARQLAQRGRKVAQLIILDGAAPLSARRGQAVDFAPPFNLDDGMWLTVLAKTLGRAQKNGGAWDPPRLAGMALPEQLAAFKRWVGDRGLFQSAEGQKMLEQLLEVHRCNYAAMLQYRPGTYAGDLTVVQARDKSPGSEILTFYDNYHKDGLGWAELTTGDVTLKSVPGDHYSFLEPPQVDHLARIVMP